MKSQLLCISDSQSRLMQTSVESDSLGIAMPSSEYRLSRQSPSALYEEETGGIFSATKES